MKANELNKQSAEINQKNIDDLERELEAQKHANAEAKDKLHDVDTEYQNQINNLTKMIQEKDKIIDDLKDTNQKLFLRIGNPIQVVNPTNDEDERDPLLDSALNKIEAYNNSIANKGAK